MNNHAFSKENSTVRVEIDRVVSTTNEHDFVLKKNSFKKNSPFD